VIRLVHKERTAKVTGDDWNRLVDLLNSALQIKTGPGLESRYNSSGYYISLIKHPLDQIHANTGSEGTSSASMVFVGEITAYSSLGSNQWEYTLQRQRKADTTGYNPGSWQHDSSADARTAYNLSEYMNSDVGVQGNGVDLANLPGSFDIMPVPVGTLVLAIAAKNEWWFQYENAVDGECE